MAGTSARGVLPAATFPRSCRIHGCAWAGLPASGSSYFPRLPILSDSGTERGSFPVTAARLRRICTVLPLARFRCLRLHLLSLCSTVTLYPIFRRVSTGLTIRPKRDSLDLACERGTRVASRHTMNGIGFPGGLAGDSFSGISGFIAHYRAKNALAASAALPRVQLQGDTR